MSSQSSRSAALRDYLLGIGSESVADAVEREYFARDETVDEIAAEEEALIDDYLSGRLSEDLRARFESHYLASPVHARRVELARALRFRTPPRSRTARVAAPLAVAAALVLAILGALRLPRQGPALSVTLPAVATRDGGAMPTLRLPERPADVELRLETVPAPAPPLEVLVRTVDGAETWQGPGFPKAGTPSVVAAAIPSARFEAGDYVVVLSSGGREIRRYSLRVVRP